ncbi:MAG TPA: cyclase family protein [Sphingomicrobium sp.]|nr:cyclase family protein [Sphingomicrobium sp.]
MADIKTAAIVDLSHVIEHGMTTYEGLPGPHICDYWARGDTVGRYDDGSTFQIGRIDMVANTGTYIDSPFHRFEDGADLAGLALDSLAGVPGVVVRRPFEQGPAVDTDAFGALGVGGKAVLIHTGWDRHWRTDSYARGHPFLTARAARLLADGGAVLVGIDSYNIDDTRTRSRPVHTTLLGAGTVICEHMRGLEQIPDDGFRFSAVPPKIRGMGSFPVRAYASIES